MVAHEGRKFSRGDVFQINERHKRQGWIGAFVLADEIKAWGIVGFVHHVEEHEKAAQAWIRLSFDEIDFVGPAPLVPRFVDD
jgi:hypothetical protein